MLLNCGLIDDDFDDCPPLCDGFDIDCCLDLVKNVLTGSYDDESSR